MFETKRLIYLTRNGKWKSCKHSILPPMSRKLALTNYGFIVMFKTKCILKFLKHFRFRKLLNTTQYKLLHIYTTPSFLNTKIRTHRDEFNRPQTKMLFSSLEKRCTGNEHAVLPEERYLALLVCFRAQKAVFMFAVFAFTITVSMILKMIQWNYHITTQNWLVCEQGTALLFNRFWF